MAWDVTPHFRGRIFEQIQANDGQTYVFHDDIRFRQEFEARSEAEEIRIQERNRRLLELQYEETLEDCHTRFCIGLTLMVEGELESSLAMLSDVIRDVGDCDCARSAQVFSIECLRKLGRAREAVEQGLEWAKLSPEYGELWFSIGRAALESDQKNQGASCVWARPKYHDGGDTRSVSRPHNRRLQGDAWASSGICESKRRGGG